MNVPFLPNLPLCKLHGSKSSFRRAQTRKPIDLNVYRTDFRVRLVGSLRNRIRSESTSCSVSLLETYFRLLSLSFKPWLQLYQRLRPEPRLLYSSLPFFFLLSSSPPPRSCSHPTSGHKMNPERLLERNRAREPTRGTLIDLKVVAYKKQTRFYVVIVAGSSFLIGQKAVDHFL